METLRIDILNPKAKQLLFDLMELRTHAHAVQCIIHNCSVKAMGAGAMAHGLMTLQSAGFAIGHICALHEIT